MTGPETFKTIKLKLTEEQKAQIMKLIRETGDGDPDIHVVLSADVKKDTLTAATFMVGAAV